MMDPFFCLFCSQTSYLDERFRCIYCGNGLEPWAAIADNFNLQQPEPENASPGCYASATNTSNQKSEEFMLVEPTRGVNNKMFEENCNFPSQIARRNAYENYPKGEIPSQNETSHTFDQYNNEAQNLLLENSSTYGGEFHSQSNNAPTFVKSIYDTTATSQQFYQSEGDYGNKHNSYELLRRQGTQEQIECGIRFGSVNFTDSISLESDNQAVSLLSNYSYQVEDKSDEVPPPFSSYSRGNQSVNKSFQENMVTGNGTVQKEDKISSGLSRWWCKTCGKFFLKERTFTAHLKNFCNLNTPYKGEECEILPNKTKLLLHKRFHTGEKPFQ